MFLGLWASFIPYNHFFRLRNRIEFLSSSYFPSNLQLSPTHLHALYKAVQNLLLQEWLFPCQSRRSSGGFTPTCSLCPILDLKDLKAFVWVHKLIRSMVVSLRQGDFPSSIDIKDSYLHVPICKGHQGFLRFAIGNAHYQFLVLHFGLASALWVFIKVLALALLRQ